MEIQWSHATSSRIFIHDLAVNIFNRCLENSIHNRNNEVTTVIRDPIYYFNASVCSFLCSCSPSLSLILNHADF